MNLKYNTLYVESHLHRSYCLWNIICSLTNCHKGHGKFVHLVKWGEIMCAGVYVCVYLCLFVCMFVCACLPLCLYVFVCVRLILPHNGDTWFSPHSKSNYPSGVFYCHVCNVTSWYDMATYKSYKIHFRLYI